MVTGGACGIGAAICYQLAKDGFLMIIKDNNKTALIELSDTLTSPLLKAASLPVDLNSEAITFLISLSKSKPINVRLSFAMIIAQKVLSCEARKGNCA